MPQASESKIFCANDIFVLKVYEKYPAKPPNTKKKQKLHPHPILQPSRSFIPKILNPWPPISVVMVAIPTLEVADNSNRLQFTASGFQYFGLLIQRTVSHWPRIKPHDRLSSSVRARRFIVNGENFVCAFLVRVRCDKNISDQIVCK